MSLVKAKGEMYSWTTHCHTHLGGKCSHGCTYCFVQAMATWAPNLKKKYSGPVRLIEKELEVAYGSGKTIFIEHLNDLWAEDVDCNDRRRIFDHLAEWPDNTYVFQTKCPPYVEERIRNCDILGTTIETNRELPEIMGNAPIPSERKMFMMQWKDQRPEVKRFITIEPILDFDVAALAFMVEEIEPAFVNIGADSKGKGLPEPTWGKVLDLIGKLEMSGIEIRRKSNLERLRR